MKRQAELAIESADVILFMVDAKDGITATDSEVADILRRSKKPVIMAINKVDNMNSPPPGAFDFYNLGLSEPVMISSVHGLAIGELLDEAFRYFPKEQIDEEDDNATKVAVIGKPNSGKSSLINRILGEDRVIVNEKPGTTRDAIDTFFKFEDGEYIFIDTAGIRKKSKVDEDIERYSVMRSWTAVDRADVCIVMIDAQDGVTEQDTKIAGYAHEQGKSSIIAVNKWDIIDKVTGTLEEYRKKVMEGLGFMQYAPIVFISAKTGQRVDRLFELIKYVADQASLRISTGMLNDVINEAVSIVQPPSDKGKRLKVYYAVQTGIKPPAFSFFVNTPDLVHYSYERYLENHLRKSFGFEGTPIRLTFKASSGRNAK
jgi:GTPase